MWGAEGQDRVGRKWCCLLLAAVALATFCLGGLTDTASASPKRGAPVPCTAAFPQAHSKSIGRTTWYNRQESVRQVVCYHFGLTPSADFPVSAGMVCGIVGAVIDSVPGGQAHKLSLFADGLDGACSGVELAADPSEPAKYVGIACGWASDLLGALVKPAGVLGSIGCATAPSVGHALGNIFESKHELDVAIDVIQHNKCIKYSPTHFGSAWLADKCASGDKGFSSLPLAPASPTPAPPASAPPPSAPQVPPTGPTVIYDGETVMGSQGGDLDFYEWEEATGENTEVVDTLPGSLMGYRCVVLLANESLEAQQENLLGAYLRSGGTILAIGEHEGSGFDAADFALNRLAGSLGVGLALNDDELDYGAQVTTSIDDSPLTAGVYALGDNWVSTLSVSGSAQALVESSEDLAPIVGAQAVGPGQFVMAGDSNMFSDNSYDAYYSFDNGQFVHNLCP